MDDGAGMVNLTGRNIELRPASSADLDARLSLGNHADIIEMFGVSRSDVRPLTREGASQWLQKLIGNPTAWVIDVHGRLVGEIRLDNLDLHDRRATMAVGIFDPQLLGKGLGSASIRLVLEHAFTHLQLHRIGIRVLAYNTRAIRAYEKCGFVQEGREREAAFVNDVWHDDVMMGLLETEHQGS
ncbi:GNAT family N-acetyltransferase [Rhizobium leguminosarum]|uniref:GNAT family N-acetyltransferase n=1 Tax=Rhizobium leguminosarum TaxID=384 RepID=UPI0032AF662C